MHYIENHNNQILARSQIKSNCASRYKPVSEHWYSILNCLSRDKLSGVYLGLYLLFVCRLRQRKANCQKDCKFCIGRLAYWGVSCEGSKLERCFSHKAAIFIESL